MGDTLASEIGILSKSSPRLILPPFAKVPPGTNGALSVKGTLGSLVGGALMGLVSGTSLLYFDNPACQHHAINYPLLQIIALGALAGLGGSAVSIEWFATTGSQDGEGGGERREGKQG